VIKINKLLPLLVALACNHPLMAQQDPLVSVNQENLIYYMPGSIGRLPYLVTNILYRRQWGQFQETPSLQIANIQMPFNYKRMAIGMQFLQESYPGFNNKSIKLIYAYKIRFAKGRLVGGLEGGIAQSSYSLAGLLIKDDEDDLLFQQNYRLAPDVGLGLFYYDSKFELGGSIKHINRPRLDENAPYSNIKAHYYAYASRKFILSNNYNLRPYALLRYPGGNKLTADLSIELGFKEYFNISMGIRSQKQLVFQTSVSLDRVVNSSQVHYNLNYSYDFATYSNTHLSSNELMLTIKFQKRPDPSRIRKRNRISSPLLF
jgi:type IX secretion system PorP/SprF family membrane protein